MTAEQHARRIANINEAEQKNRSYFRRTRIHDYRPGQVTYGLGDYPAYVSARPTEYDYNLLKQMAEGGVELVQVHEEWNDACRLYGADKFHSPDAEGMKEFVKLCHSLGMKVIPYVSSGFFPYDDPDFRSEFARTYPVAEGGFFNEKRLWCTQNYFNYRKCAAGSAQWREYILPRTFRVMEEYGFDGIFNDWGYDKVAYQPEFVDALPYDPEIEDLLCMIYGEVKRRGGIYKLHADRNNAPPVKDRVYDYLWIGEAVTDKTPGAGKGYPNYVVPCIDLHYAAEAGDAGMARTIPYLQFPLLKYGRPILGNNQNLPGVTYWGGDEQEFYGRVAEYMKKNPNGPYVYSLWSAIPDDPDEYPNWLKYLKLYRPMVAENNLAYIELSESAYILSPLGKDMVASMFVGEDIYLAVSNFASADYILDLEGSWRDRVTGQVGSRFVVSPNKILFLVRE